MRREIAVTARVPMTCGGVLRRDGFVRAGLCGLGSRRAECAQDRLGLRAGGKRLRYGRSERSHQDCKQSDEAAELADEATAHGADVDYQSG